MAPGFEAKQGQQLLPELLRTIALRKETGYLSLYHDKITRTIAFESGEPINAFSNLPSEQLDSRLTREGAVAAGLVNSVKRSNPDPFMLGQALVEKGVVSFEVMTRIAGELATQIALSLFQWIDAEHQFDNSERPTCPRVIQTNAADLIVEGTRQAAARTEFVDLVAPPNLKVARNEIADEIAVSARLSSTEGYVLALTNSPASLTEIAELTGLPDELVRPAVCVLLALGLLQRVEESEEPITPPADHARVEELPAEQRSLLEGIRRKLHVFQTASHYEVLGVSERSSAAVINEAHQQLEKMLEAQLAEFGNRQEIRLPLEELRARVREAHAILGNSTRRLQYDRARATSQPSSSSTLTPDMNRGGATGNGGGLNAADPRSTGPRKPTPLPLPLPTTAARRTTPLPPPTTAPRKSTQLPPPVPTPARKPAPLPFTMPTAEPPLPSELLKRKNPEPIIERGQASESRNDAQRIPARKPIPIPEIKMPVAPKNAPDIRVERGQWDGSGLPRPPRPSGPLTRPPAVLSPEEASRFEAGANKEEQAFHFYRQGRLRFERHELDAATHLFRAAVNLDASKATYHFHLAVALSIRANARYEHLHHEGCHVTCKLGGSLVSNPKVRYEAEQHFLRAAEIDPTDDEIPLKLGVLYKEAGLLKKAAIYLQQALMLNSRNETAQRELESLNEAPQENNGIDTGLLRRGSGQGG